MTTHLFKAKYPKVFASSVDPYKLSMTIKGIIIGIAPAILIFAPGLHWTVTLDDFTAFGSAVQASIVAIGAAVSAVMVVWGFIRKVLVFFGWIKTA